MCTVIVSIEQLFLYFDSYFVLVYRSGCTKAGRNVNEVDLLSLSATLKRKLIIKKNIQLSAGQYNSMSHR